MQVVMIAASTVCGRISPAVMGSSLDRRRLEQARAATDASLMGAATLRRDDPEMKTCCSPDADKRIRAIVSGSGQVPVQGKKLFATGGMPIVFTAGNQQEALARTLADKARVIALPPGPGGLSISAAIAELARMGAGSVLIEGGARLNYSCLAEGIVDEIFLTVAPYLSGERLAATLADGDRPLGCPFLALELLSCEPVETGELFLRYRVIKDDLSVR